VLIGSRVDCQDNGWPWVTLNCRFIRIARFSAVAELLVVLVIPRPLSVARSHFSRLRQNTWFGGSCHCDPVWEQPMITMNDTAAADQRSSGCNCRLDRRSPHLVYTPHRCLNRRWQVRPAACVTEFLMTRTARLSELGAVVSDSTEQRTIAWTHFFSSTNAAW